MADQRARGQAASNEGSSSSGQYGAERSAYRPSPDASDHIRAVLGMPEPFAEDLARRAASRGHAVISTAETTSSGGLQRIFHGPSGRVAPEVAVGEQADPFALNVHHVLAPITSSASRAHPNTASSQGNSSSTLQAVAQFIQRPSSGRVEPEVVPSYQPASFGSTAFAEDRARREASCARGHTPSSGDSSISIIHTGDSPTPMMQYSNSRGTPEGLMHRPSYRLHELFASTTAHESESDDSLDWEPYVASWSDVKKSQNSRTLNEESTSQNPAFSDRPMNRPVSVALAVDTERDVEPRKSDPGLSTANDNPNQAGNDDQSNLGPKVMKDNFLTGGQVDDGPSSSGSSPEILVVSPAASSSDSSLGSAIPIRTPPPAQVMQSVEPSPASTPVVPQLQNSLSAIRMYYELMDEIEQEEEEEANRLANAAKKEAMLSKSESIVTIRSTSSHPIAAAEDDVEEILVANEVIPPTSNSTSSIKRPKEFLAESPEWKEWSDDDSFSDVPYLAAILAGRDTQPKKKNFLKRARCRFMNFIRKHCRCTNKVDVFNE